jgi:hypothetical protein
VLEVRENWSGFKVTALMQVESIGGMRSGPGINLPVKVLILFGVMYLIMLDNLGRGDTIAMDVCLTVTKYCG